MRIRSIIKNSMGDEKKKIIMVGGSGLVGSRLKELLEIEYDVEDYSLGTGFDITKAETLTPLLHTPSGATIVHLAAKADVDGCEKDKALGENGPAWQINVLGAHNVADACVRAGHRLIYISTDFVFDGKSPPSGGYTEADIPNPINWYAVTKYEGEKRVLSSTATNVILRIAYPYRAYFEEKMDFVRAILSRLQRGEKVAAVTDHIMTPTFVDDIAIAIATIVEQKLEGIYHGVGSSSLSPSAAVASIARVFAIDNPQVTEVTRAEFFKDRASRPFNLTLRNDKMRQLGVTMKTFEEGLEQMKLDIKPV